ncbi:MAG: efflux transporter outer membrane subunit [Rhodoferax sp.]|nr:efflux transporter outer membrane subunit [Rhodoferax sp.]
MNSRIRRCKSTLCRPLLLLTPLVAALAGCAVGPDFQRPAPPAVTDYTRTAFSSETVTSPGQHGIQQQFITATVPIEWWKELHSEKLTRLIDQALAASPTLMAAKATLRQAEQSYAATSGSTQLPQVNAKLGDQRQGTNTAAAGMPDGERTYNLYSATIAVSYDLDLAGGNQRTLEALAAQVNYQSYQLEGARLTLASSLALTAITQAQLSAQIAATSSLLNTQEEQLTLTRKRLELGVGTQLEVLALQTQLEQVRASLPTLRNKQEQTRHLLAVLAGQAPGASNTPDFVMSDFSLPQALPVSVPSELMRRRPDVRASEALLQAASAQYGVAVSKLYPQLTLTANLGSQALTTAGLFGAGSMIWSLGGQLAQPLFTPGLKANAKASEAAMQAAQANYQQTVLQSLRNVADVLRTIESDAQVQQSLESANASAQTTVQLVQTQYALGSASYLQLLLAQQQAQQTFINVLELRARRVANTVTLYQAMGGGYRA